MGTLLYATLQFRPIYQYHPEMPASVTPNRLQRLIAGTTGRRVVCALALLPVLALVYAGAFWLRFEGTLASQEMERLATTIGWVLCIKLAVFGSFRVFQGWSRYVTFHDLMTLGKAATASMLILVLVDYLFLVSTTIPRSIVLMDWGITIVAIGGLRSISRIIQERSLPLRPQRDKTPVLIVGTSDAGESLLRSIRRNPKLPFRVVGFITKDSRSVGTRISGISVLGELSETGTISSKHQVSSVFITADDLSGQEVRALVEDARGHGIDVRVLPGCEQLLQGNVDLRPRTVSIEDLLRRDPVQLDLDALHDWIDGRVLLVTGSAGSIGSEICRQLLAFSPRKLVLVDRSENGQFFLERELRELTPDEGIEICIGDVNDAMRMNALFNEHRPDIVFHAAAYKHVPLMEANPGEAVKNIVLATRLFADLANQHDVKSFVMISTDKAVNPTSVMGACKRIAELYVQALAARSNCRFVTVRFGNVLDSAGSVVPIFREQIARGGPVTVTHPEMRRFFMTIPEASQLVIQAGVMGQGGEIFVLDMGQPVRIADLAGDMIRLSGLRVGLDVKVQFVGMRPGEKLYEELHVEGEYHLATAHPKILVAQSKRVDFGQVTAALSRLQRVAEGPTESIRAALGNVVPQYEYGTRAYADVNAAERRVA